MALTVTTTAVPLPLILCDYLMFYGFVGQDAGRGRVVEPDDASRYTDGFGVQMMRSRSPVETGGTSFFVTYTNSDGVWGELGHRHL